MFMFWWLWDFGRGEQALHKLVFIHRLHKAGVIRRPLGLAQLPSPVAPTEAAPPVLQSGSEHRCCHLGASTECHMRAQPGSPQIGRAHV